MRLLPTLLAFAVGVGLVIQVGMNMALSRAFGSPVAASVVYFAVGTLALGAFVLALTVAGQMVASLVVDHNGWLGFAQQPVSVLRLLGVAFLVLGIVLIAR